MTAPSRYAWESQEAALVVIAGTFPVRNSQLAAAVVISPIVSVRAYASQMAALVVYQQSPNNVPKNSQFAALVVYGTETPTETRTRAWKFDWDGHTFYVLDLGVTGTFLFDITTGQWCQFQTDGFLGWNFRFGATFSEYGRVVGADTSYGLLYELDPQATLDEGFRNVIHTATGGIVTRSRVFQGVEMLRITGSQGFLENSEPTTLTMTFSDDNGATWSDPFVVTLTPGDFGGEVSWTSLGSFMSPGRVFNFVDVGGMLRIDGADIFIENFDDTDLLTKEQAAYYGKVFTSA